MQKILFFDNWGLEIVDGLTRRLNQPVKHAVNPLFIADQPWEEGNMQTYGSVIKLPNMPYQLWYSVMHHRNQAKSNICLAYAESDDGLTWRKPLLDVVRYKGRKTNLVMDNHIHGPAIIYDPVAQLYRLIVGTKPSGCISVYFSKDGIHWTPMNQGPVIANNPDCSMGLVRTRKGQFAAYHRHPSTGRRVCRTTSWDFRFWESEPKMVLEPDAKDPPQVQFYALGSSMYGNYELGTLWHYKTEAKDLSTWHMNGQQHTELAYSRNGYCWHRAAQGQPFIPHGTAKQWDGGNLQCASQPVFLDDEIRYYYTGTDRKHSMNWEHQPHTAGLGMASIKPDRFVALESSTAGSDLLTAAFALGGPQIFVNAAVARRGELRVEVLSGDGRPIKGYTATRCLPISGDKTSHAVLWQGHGDVKALVGKSVRLRIRSTSSRLFSIYIPAADETPVYHQFSSPF